jgi:hypothetical protein
MLCILIIGGKNLSKIDYPFFHCGVMAVFRVNRPFIRISPGMTNFLLFLDSSRWLIEMIVIFSAEKLSDTT